MVIFVDMDGVLSDLDGQVARRADVNIERLGKDRELRRELIINSIRSQGLEHWTGLAPMNKQDWVRKFRTWTSWGHQVEILTSYGIDFSPLHTKDHGLLGRFELEALAHRGKAQWLETHYGDQCLDNSIRAFNGVGTCGGKARFGRPDTLLIDDQPENVREFRAAGGSSLQYRADQHDAVMSNAEILLRPRS